MVARDLGQVWQSQPNICQQRWTELGWGAKTITTNFLLRINPIFTHNLHSPNQTTSPLRSSLANVMTSHYCWHCWDSSILNIAFESCSFDINVWRTPTTMCENINFLPTSPGSVEIRSLSSRMIFGASLTRVLASINHEKVIGPIWGLVKIPHYPKYFQQ